MSVFRKIAARIGRLVEEKYKAYGDSVGCSGIILRALYPRGIRPEQYDSMLLAVRIIDKLKREAEHNGRDPMGESPFEDIAGYGIRGVELDERRSRAQHDSEAA